MATGKMFSAAMDLVSWATLNKLGFVASLSIYCVKYIIADFSEEESVAVWSSRMKSATELVASVNLERMYDF